MSEIGRMIAEPIPLGAGNVAGWKDVPIVESHEIVVPIGRKTEYEGIYTDAVYVGERISSPYFHNPIEGSNHTIFTRKSVAEALVLAQEKLPIRMRLIVFDAHRPFSAQKALYDRYFTTLRGLWSRATEDELATETAKYVSAPSTSSERPSPHNTGGAVDLAIVELASKRDGFKLAGSSVTQHERDQILSGAKMVPFGTPFDYGGPEAALDSLEKARTERMLTQDEEDALFNRRLLFHVMSSVGLQPYGEEWWHYNATGAQMGAKVAGHQIAEFGPVTLSENNLAHERVIREDYTRRLKKFKRGSITVSPIATQVNEVATILPSAPDSV
jgi:D-alanyl-D-alanine dipeptidase